MLSHSGVFWTCTYHFVSVRYKAFCLVVANFLFSKVLLRPSEVSRDQAAFSKVVVFLTLSPFYVMESEEEEEKWTFSQKNGVIF